MAKSNYRGNLSKEQIKELEVERQEKLEELAVKKSKGIKRRQARTERHHEWATEGDDE